jgi:hypothetical protein
MSSFSLNEYRGEAKVKFRNKFIEYFSNKTSSNFSFHKLETFELKKFVNDYFKTLNGKCIRLDEKTLLVAIHDEEKVIAYNNGVRSLTDLLESEILENYNIKQTSFEFPKENILQLLPYLDNENNAKFSIAADPKPKYGK